jgi:hypothetical protein
MYSCWSLNFEIKFQGTKELPEAFKNLEIILALCNAARAFQKSHIRQSAVSLPRGRLANKSKHWTELQVKIPNE